MKRLLSRSSALAVLLVILIAAAPVPDSQSYSEPEVNGHYILAGSGDQFCLDQGWDYATNVDVVTDGPDTYSYWDDDRWSSSYFSGNVNKIKDLTCVK